jgi:protein-S-isoprenylcysteine O-methyltransferase Ste14
MAKTRAASNRFRKAAIGAGDLVAALMLIGWVSNTVKAGAASDLRQPLMWLLPALAAIAFGALTWGAITLVGRVVTSVESE